MSRKALDKLATKYVGDGKTSLIFVTDDTGVIAAFFSLIFLADAKKIANSFESPCWVEDRNGTVYDNAASARRQAEEDD